jgi:hypothetical protein
VHRIVFEIMSDPDTAKAVVLALLIGFAVGLLLQRFS